MPLFEVRVVTTIKYLHKLMVQADNHQAAVDWVNISHDWHGCGCLDNGSFYKIDEYKALSAQEINHKEQLPGDWATNDVPFNCVGWEIGQFFSGEAENLD